MIKQKNLANPSIFGRSIADVRPMNAAELKREGWDRPGMVIVLDDRTRVFASQDEEGNGPGALFGIGADGKGFYIIAGRRS